MISDNYKILSLLALGLASIGYLAADNTLFPCQLPPFALSPPDHFASCCDFEGHVDFLYLKGKVSDGILTSGRTTNFGLKEIYIDWNGGFDFGIGWNFPEDRWGLSFDWFHFSSTSTFDLPFGLRTVSTIQSFAPSDYLLSYGIGWQGNYTIGDLDFAMNFNLLELAIKRTFITGPALTLTPKAALVALFIRDSVDVTLIGPPLSRALDFGRIDTRQLVNGVGGLMGLASDWDVGCGFSFYGAFDVAFVSYATKIIETSTLSSSETEQTGAQFQVDQFDPLLRYQLGGRWCLPFCQDNMSCSLSLGWQALLFFNQDHFNAYSFSEAKPLSLQGLIFSVAVSL